MKQHTLKSLRFNPITLCALLCLVAYSAKAQTYFCPGPIVNGGIYSWDGPNWSTTSGCASPTTWLAGSFARFYGGAGVSYTVTVNASESMAGMYNDAGSANTLIISDAGNGTGSLSIVPNSIQDGFGPCQGFLTSGGVTTINCPMTGTGGVEEESGGGHLQLFGTNTYSGGTLFTSSSTFVDYNNTGSFGTGPIGYYNTTFSIMEANGSSPITITNAIQILGGTTGIDFVNQLVPVTLTGPWNLGTFSVNIRVAAGSSSASLTLSGPMSNTSGTLNYSANGPAATIYVTGASTYAGPTTIGGGGNASPIVSVTSINSVNTPTQQASSSLGKPSSVANGTIGIGTTTLATGSSVLIYTGAGETSDRVINLLGTTSGATIEMDGAGPLILTSAFTATGAGSKTLTLQGSSTAANTIGGAIVDNSSANKTSLVKAQAGKWKLSGVNTYSGGTTVSAGTLEVAGSIAGNVAVNGGVLQLDNATALSSPSTATVTIASGATVNLNFSGIQVINGLTIGGTSEPTGSWGAVGSGAQHTSSALTGAGWFNVGGAPVITAQPQSAAAWPDASVTFTVTATGSPSYLWARNGVNIGTATQSSYTFQAETANAGTYTCGITNVNGGVVTTGALLTVRTTNAYTTTVRGDSPISYWRLDESGGTTAFDAVGPNNGTYNNVILNHTPGYSVIDPDPCVYLPAVGSYVANAGVFDFFTNSGPQFTLEGWAYFTNVTSGVQRLFSCFQIAQYPTNCGYAFGIKDQNTLEFSTLGGFDYAQATGSPLQNNVWYQLAVGCDGSALHFYVNGQPVGTQSYPNGGSGLSVAEEGTASAAMTLGADNDPGLPNLHEQVLGFLDECAIYGTFLGDAEIQNHYNASLPSAPVAQTPVADQPTNYVSLTTTFIENAVGMNLNYQWTKNGSPVGADSSTLTLANLQPGDAATYRCLVSNTGGSTNPPGATLTVLPIPTTASQVGLSNALVLHLPFDGNYSDISGYHNNGTGVGSPTLLADTPVIGTGYLHYESDSGTPSYNYVALGKPALLQFSSNVSFSVAFWIRQAYGNISTNLPFFGNTVGGIGGAPGFCFAPALASGGSPNGAWEWSGSDGTHSIADTGTPSSISDGNWHHLAFVFVRGANGTTYLDGQYTSTQPIAAITTFDSGTNFNIGQDATGKYANPSPTSGDMDDLGVWRRALTQLEISGMYLAGVNNTPGVSFAPAITLAPAPTPTTISNIIGTTLSYGGGSGSQFVLVGSSNVAAPLSGWTRIHTNTATPGTFTITVGSGAQFYRVKSE